MISQSNSEGDRTSKNIATKPNTIFNEVSGISSAKHSETFFDDFELQPLLPNKLSHYGPGLAVGDTNRDGVNEFIVSSAKGETLSIHSQKTILFHLKLYLLQKLTQFLGYESIDL